MLAVKDRQDRWQSFFYENGHLTEIWDGQTPKSGNQLDKIDYAGAGSVTHWTTPDAKIDYAGFTLDDQSDAFSPTLSTVYFRRGVIVHFAARASCRLLRARSWLGLRVRAMR
ncbi:MAG: hypothetical protein WB973_11595 [Thermoanaerobaculia bacterium]